MALRAGADVAAPGWALHLELEELVGAGRPRGNASIATSGGVVAGRRALTTSASIDAKSVLAH